MQEEISYELGGKSTIGYTIRTELKKNYCRENSITRNFYILRSKIVWNILQYYKIVLHCWC